MKNIILSMISSLLTGVFLFPVKSAFALRRFRRSEYSAETILISA
jgi:hypothetical protein